MAELKWNQEADTAICQIREKQYPISLEQYTGNILLVGISYRKEAPAGERKHACVIERFHADE